MPTLLVRPSGVRFSRCLSLLNFNPDIMLRPAIAFTCREVICGALHIAPDRRWPEGSTTDVELALSETICARQATPTCASVSAIRVINVMNVMRIITVIRAINVMRVIKVIRDIRVTSINSFFRFSGFNPIFKEHLLASH